MRHSILIAALTLTTIGVGAARADADFQKPAADRQSQGAVETYPDFGRNADDEGPDARLRPGILNLAEMESHGRGDDSDDDEGDDDEDEEDDGGGSSTVLPNTQSGAPATVPAPKNPLINGNGRPSVVVQ